MIDDNEPTNKENMPPIKKAPPSAATEDKGLNQSLLEGKHKKNNGIPKTKSAIIREPQKQEVALIELEARLEKGINTLEAANAYSDTCLHTTVSDLKRNHGLVLERKTDPYQNKKGRRTPFKRYWVNPNDLPKVRSIVNTLRVTRGEFPLYEVEQGSL